MSKAYDIKHRDSYRARKAQGKANKLARESARRDTRIAQSIFCAFAK